MGVRDLFDGKPRQPVGPGGHMPLADHFRELRARLMRSALVIVLAFCVALYFYHPLLDFIAHPYVQAQEHLKGKVDAQLTVNGLAGGLMLQFKLCGWAALVGSSPYWLYQIWAFIMPGLHPNERKWTRLFAAVAGPLFMAGVALGYYVLPKGAEVLMTFTPKNAVLLNEFGSYFSFITRMLLVFGISMEIPLFVVLLNLAGVLRGETLARYRPWIILLTFVFAAVATPSTDPFSMLMLGSPMAVLFLVAEVIARTVDRARGRRRVSYGAVSDDQASPL